MLKKIYFITILFTTSLIIISCGKTTNEHYEKSQELAEAKNFKAAIMELNDAIEIDPNFAEAYLDRARYRFNLGYFEAASKTHSEDLDKYEMELKSSIKDFDKAKELDSNLTEEALTGRGNVYMELKNYNKALSDFEEILKIDSTNKQINGIAVHCKLLLKDTIGAKSLVDGIIRISPNDAENYYNRAVLQLTTFNNKDGACEDLEKAKGLYNEEDKYLSQNLKGEIEKLIEINCTK
ncbi:MAG: tetratricopeptide repeat protein [Melioribacteraceae bacterium]|nr:tetratricopeptide repeat protein [Melioribacteraceae bacterium]MCF8395120.1 tetratricopeptide repeat protein [Melioribacteraceae bacterium]MCF8420529.1 tetratricopeptide repeat protein [Melioribacteraceae bacterium]